MKSFSFKNPPAKPTSQPRVLKHCFLGLFLLFEWLLGLHVGLQWDSVLQSVP